MTKKSNSKPASPKPWAGRFVQPTAELLEQFSASVDTDRVLAEVDLRASAAHAKMLSAVGVITAEDCQTLLAGLETIATEIDDQKFCWRPELEDVHMNIEARLIELCGEVGKRLHTARSRNDQIATDTRLYLRHWCEKIDQALTNLQGALLKLAEQHTHTLMPSYTHFQVAQPTVLAHHVMAWYEAIDRDWHRLQEVYQRVNVLPLGSAALVGTSWPIDRAFVQRELGFASISTNSLDSVSDRDYQIEFCGSASISAMHLSRMAEEMIIWLNPQFDFISLSDAWCTGSSIMPQKKNPDALELIRGKTSHCYGALITLLSLMKSQPLAYNRDMQEDKPPLFNCARQWYECLSVMALLIPDITVNTTALETSLQGTYATATDLADYLVRQNIPFRDAHHITGRIVQQAIAKKCELDQLPLKDLQKFCPQIKEDIYAQLSLEGSVKSRQHLGATAPNTVAKAIKQAKQSLSKRTTKQKANHTP